MWGMGPLSEAVIQARGQVGDRQADRHDVVLVSGNGRFLDQSVPGRWGVSGGPPKVEAEEKWSWTETLEPAKGVVDDVPSG
jgi:hypothetical protein